MKTIYALLAVLLITSAAHAYAEELVVVAGPASPLSGLSTEELSKLYLGQTSMDGDGREVTVYDLEDAAVRGDFSRAALSMSLIQLRAYRAKQVFTGRGRPPRQLKATELIERLNNEVQAIGYLPPDQARGLKILYRLQL